MARTHPAERTADELLAECTIKRTRRSGPGGQHRNKVETAIVVQHDPTGVRAEASEERSQSRNHAVAMQRLRTNLALEVRTSADDSPSPRWLERSRGGRVNVSEQHQDFAALVAEAFDVLAEEGFDHRAAADRLSVSMNQLTRFLRKSPVVFQWLNEQRHSAGLHPLR